MHYARHLKYGDPNVVKVPQLHGMTVQERLLHYTRKGEGCWEWQSSRDPNGYGRLNVQNVPVLAHRLSYEFHCGEIPKGLHVLHRCDNPACVRPDHLFLGDQPANNADMRAKGRFRPGVSRGERHGCAKLTTGQVREIRAWTGAARIMAEKHGISLTQAQDIRRRKSWAHLPD